MDGISQRPAQNPHNDKAPDDGDWFAAIDPQQQYYPEVKQQFAPPQVSVSQPQPVSAPEANPETRPEPTPGTIAEPQGYNQPNQAPNRNIYEPAYIVEDDPGSVSKPTVDFVAPAAERAPMAAVAAEGETVPETPSAGMIDEKVSYNDAQIQELDIVKIVPNPFQPRKLFNPEALQELANSIREHGVVQPIVVTESPTGYEIVVGERRFRASQLAGLTKIPAIVKKSLHDQTKLEVALIENIQRQELNAIEEAQAYDRLIKSFNMTQDQVAKKVGKSRPAVTNTLRLLNLPAEIQRGVIEGRITEGHARAILGLPDVEKQILMYQTIQEQGLNVRQVESKVREIAVKRRLDAATPDPKLMALESELRGKLGAQVKIQRQGRGGKITIEFFSDEDLEEIMNRMAEDKHSDASNYFTV